MARLITLVGVVVCWISVAVPFVGALGRGPGVVAVVVVRADMGVSDNACRGGVAPGSFPDVSTVKLAGILVGVVPVSVECAVHSVNVDCPKNLVLMLVVPGWCVSRTRSSSRNTGEVFLEVARVGRRKS